MSKIHHDIEFMVLRKKLNHTSSMDEKITLLEQLTALNPRNPQNLALRRKYREELESLRMKRGSKKKVVPSLYEAFHYKRQVTLVGMTNTGKSTLINKLTGSHIPTEGLPYSTHHPEAQMMNCKDVSMQIIEIPALFSGDTDAAKYRFIRNCDVMCICAKTKDDLEEAVNILKDNLITPVNRTASTGNNKNKSGNEAVEIPSIAVVWGTNIPGANLAVLDINDIESISDRIYRLFSIKRIFYLKQKEVHEKPLVFPAEQEVKVTDFIRILDKRLLTKFRRIKVIHSDTAIPDVHAAGPDYILKDGDMVEIII